MKYEACQKISCREERYIRSLHDYNSYTIPYDVCGYGLSEEEARYDLFLLLSGYDKNSVKFCEKRGEIVVTKYIPWHERFWNWLGEIS